jgi:hypothetical protein
LKEAARVCGGRGRRAMGIESGEGLEDGGAGNVESANLTEAKSWLR